jgi:hypothetical protein
VEPILADEFYIYSAFTNVEAVWVALCLWWPTLPILSCFLSWIGEHFWFWTTGIVFITADNYEIHPYSAAGSP